MTNTREVPPQVDKPNYLSLVSLSTYLAKSDLKLLPIYLAKSAPNLLYLIKCVLQLIPSYLAKSALKLPNLANNVPSPLTIHPKCAPNLILAKNSTKPLCTYLYTYLTKRDKKRRSGKKKTRTKTNENLANENLEKSHIINYLFTPIYNQLLFILNYLSIYNIFIQMKIIYITATYIQRRKMN